MEESQEIIKEFLIESTENLAQLDQDFVLLEEHPSDPELLARIFRTIHTIKGTCGFLGFGLLEGVAHRSENILSQLRDGERQLTPELTDLLLESVDAVRTLLGQIEERGEEGADSYQDLRHRLQALCERAGPGVTHGFAVDNGVMADRGPAAPHQPHSGPKELAEPPAGGESASPPPASQRGAVTDSTIRVDVTLLDRLMNLVGELVLARNQILQYMTTVEDAPFHATCQRLNLITTELQASVMKTRMQPIGVVWNKFPRVVRDLGQSFGKKIQLAMEGAETELDKTIIEAIKDPLTHIVRNSCDHGIESTAARLAAGKPALGSLTLRAYHEGGQVNIEIADDGGGIDPARIRERAIQKHIISPEQAERMNEREIVNLVFSAGLSTASKLTNVSGRGVGMDVVRANIERIGGSIDLQSTPGQGTTIKIRIPLTLAIIPALVVNCADERFAIPQVNLLELVRLESDVAGKQIESIHGAPVYRLRGKLLPLVYLSEILRIEGRAGGRREAVNIIVLQAGDTAFGLVVDGLSDTAEIVVKPLSKLLKHLECYAGATIMGDGKVALILDVGGLARLGGVAGEQARNGRHAEASAGELAPARQTILLFRAGESSRLAAPLSLVDRLEEFPASRLERSGGRLVVQYRGQILPLISLGGAPPGVGSGEKLQVIVFSDGPRRLGVLVDEIIDILEESITVRSQLNRTGLTGSAVVGEQVTDFVDVYALLNEATEHGRGAGMGNAGKRIMLADSSRFARGVMRNYFEMAGYQVAEAVSAGDLLEKLGRGRVDVVLSSLDLPDEDPYVLLRKIRQAPDLARLPVVALAAESSTGPRPADLEHDFDDYQCKNDREAMLRSVHRLAAALAAERTLAEAH